MTGGASGTNGEGIGTNGAPAVTNGVPAFGYVAAAVGTILVTSMNVWSGLDANRATEWRAPIYEYTSAALILALLWPIGLLVRHALNMWPGRRPTAAALLLAGLPVFAIAHVSGFVLLRTFIFEALGQTYVFGGSHGWTFELPKEVAIYGIVVLVLAAASLNGRASAAPDPMRIDTVENHPRLLLREGQRQFHVHVDEISAVSSAGNYIEYHLVDGRRPLVRGTLAACDAELAEYGFLRSHRSWLVNPRLIAEVLPAASGDRRIILSGGVYAPLSRRLVDDFEAALPSKRANTHPDRAHQADPAAPRLIPAS